MSLTWPTAEPGRRSPEVRYERDDRSAGQRLGLKASDEKLCGLQGRRPDHRRRATEHGKTAIAMNIAEHVAVEERKPVVAQLRWGRQQTRRPMLASVGKIDRRIRSGKPVDEDWDRTTGALSKMHMNPMHIDERDQRRADPRLRRTTERRRWPDRDRLPATDDRCQGTTATSSFQT